MAQNSKTRLNSIPRRNWQKNAMQHVKNITTLVLKTLKPTTKVHYVRVHATEEKDLI